MSDILQKIVNDEYEIQKDMYVAADGGTIYFTVKDDNGDTYKLYLDGRIKSETKNVFYKDAYPGREGSVQLGHNDELVAKVKTALRNS